MERQLKRKRTNHNKKRKRHSRFRLETVLLIITCLLVTFTLTLYAWPVLADHLESRLEHLTKSDTSDFLNWLIDRDVPVKEYVTIEAGQTQVVPQLFLVNPALTAEWLDATDVPDGFATGSFSVQLRVDGQIYTAVLQVEDTTAPVVETRDISIWQGEPVAPDDFIENIEDHSPTAVAFSESPDLTRPGSQAVSLLVTDASDNQTEAFAQLTIKTDDEPPVISGTKDLTVYVGDRVAYREGVTATDNRDGDVPVEIDSSQVNLRQEGTYPVYYSAMDEAGNRSETTITVTVKTPVPEGVDEQALYDLADQILQEITHPGMTQTEVARAIYDYTRGHIRYVNESDKSNWLLGADQGLRQQFGDCYNYFAAAKLLLTRAGIENVDVLKTGGGHYWSLVDLGYGWYHFDTTPRRTGGEFFMLTDAELTAYSEKNGDSHIWDASLYPETGQEPFAG